MFAHICILLYLTGQSNYTTKNTSMRPNVLIVGTPGTGKTTLSKKLIKRLDGYKRIELSKAINKHRLFNEWDDEMGASIFDEKLVRNYIKSQLNKYNSRGIGIILDFHSADFLKRKWFDIIICLNSETHILYDRLKKRNYEQSKIRENVECEIFKVVRFEVSDKFGEGNIIDLPSNTTSDKKSNIDVILRKIQKCNTERT
ncbi:TAF9 RNA polymerase II, TATA box binding protein (TBP)-associated factor isoform 2 family protein [Cryptosporidium felis]|nr:TAF9 RNA polymerase II, TATA box binding protein (TBP)-associated factor isoform 2 family protein [Cryptosporidium felis]